MENTNTYVVGGIAPAMTHARAVSGFGVVNADRRLRRTWGDVCLSTRAAEAQGTVLPIVTPVGVELMTGAQFDKYRTGSHAIGVSG